MDKAKLRCRIGGVCLFLGFIALDLCETINHFSKNSKFTSRQGG